MCVKLPFRDLNFGPCPPHFTSISACEVTIAPRVCGGICICIIPIANHMLGKIRIINSYMHIKSLHLLEIY